MFLSSGTNKKIKETIIKTRIELIYNTDDWKTSSLFSTFVKFNSQ